MAKKLKLTANNSSTMYDLAKVFGTTVDELKKYNNLNSNIIKSGLEFYWETDDVEGVKKRLSDLQKYRLAKYEKDKAAYDKEQAAKKKSALSFKDLHAKDEDYGDLTLHQINDYQNFKKQGLGNSVQDFKAYKEKVAPYTMIYDTTSKTNRQYNGKLVAKRGLQAKGGAQDVMHTTDGEIPLMHKWTSVHKGNTYKSPYWEEVNPQRFIASKMMAPYEGTGWMNRRSYGDTMDFFSPQSYDEFALIAKSSYNKEGLSMYNHLKLDKLKYNLKFDGKDPQGDLIIGRNTNKAIASGSKSDADRLIGYNQKGNRQSAELFTTPEGDLIHLGSDFGGTGSGGSTDLTNIETLGGKLKALLVGRAKSSMDLGAYSMPVTGLIQRAKLVNKGKNFTSGNVEAYHKDGLPKVDLSLADRKYFHFRRGGKIIPKIYGL